MSHSDLCGRCHQQRRVHIDTVAGLLCPTARFQAPAPRAPEAREPEPAPAEGAQDTSMELIHRGVAAAARVLAGQGIDTRGKLDLPPEVVSEVGEILAGGYGASPASGSTRAPKCKAHGIVWPCAECEKDNSREAPVAASVQEGEERCECGHTLAQHQTDLPMSRDALCCAGMTMAEACPCREWRPSHRRG